MIKVLIADDELPIRDWLKFTLAKVQRPVDLISVVSNGKEALDAFYENQPDLIITDIKMPVMDGLELVKTIRNTNRTIYIAILTSHNDFEYARNALAYGADEYILKNEIDSQVLEKLIDACTRKITARIPQQAIPRKEYLCDLMQSQDEKLILKFEDEGIRIPLQTAYFVVAAQIPAIEEQHFSISQSGSYHENGYNIPYSVFDYDYQVKIWVVSLAGISSTLMQLNIIHSFYNKIQKVPVINCVMSGITDRNTSLQEIIQNTVTRLSDSFYGSSATIKDSMNAAARSINGTEKVQDLFYISMVSITNKNFSQAEDSINKLLQHIYIEKFSDITQVKIYFSDIVNAYKVVLLGSGLENFDNVCLAADQEIKNAPTFQLLDTTVQTFFKTVNSMSINRHANYSAYVKSAIAIVQKDYSKISKITDVTDKLNINMEYFCRLFKNDVGKTFNDYLTDYRINVAENLIKTTHLSLIEIAEQAGYNNFAYFARLYKKRRGINVNQVRKQSKTLPD